MRQEAGELAEDEDLVPFVDDLFHLVHEHVELGRWFVGARRVDQARVAGGLAQAQEGFEHLDLVLLELVAAQLQQGGAVVGEQLVVELALGGLEVAVQGRSILSGRSLTTCFLVRRRMKGRSALESRTRACSSWPMAPVACFLKTLAVPSMPGFRNSKIDQSSPRWFSIGVPVMARR